MGILIARDRAQRRHSLPAWLEAFEPVRIESAGTYTRAAHGHCVLLYVIDGMLDLRSGPPALRRALPGELAVIRGFETLDVGNGSHEDELHMCVIAFADTQGASKGIISRYFSDDDKSGAFRLVASERGEAGALAHGAALRLSLTSLGRAETVVYQMTSRESAWACAIAGCVIINNVALEPGDCALIFEVEDLRVSAPDAGQLLLIECQLG